MNLPPDHPEDLLQFWQQRVKASRWLICKTLGLGLLAAVLGVLGQGWLEDASPLLPIISQNYGLWQAGYLLALLVTFLIWGAAMWQKFGLLRNSKQGRAMQRRVIEQNERIAQKKLEAKLLREQRQQERLAADSFLTRGPRSNKFDY